MNYCSLWHVGMSGTAFETKLFMKSSYMFCTTHLINFLLPYEDFPTFCLYDLEDVLSVRIVVFGIVDDKEHLW